MDDHSIVGQLKTEILNLEEAVQQLDERKKQLKAEIRTRRRALKLLDRSRSAYGAENLSPM